MERINLPAVMENLDPLMEFIRNCSSAAGFDQKHVNQINLACEEAVVNVINYAYPDSEGQVEILFDRTAGGQGIMIELRDSGIPFDPLAKEDPDINAPVDDRPIGGLGVFMVKQIMDEVGYRYEDGQNILTMRKSLTGSDAKHANA